YKIPVVYKGSRIQGIEPTTRWYGFIYKPGTTPMEKDDKGCILRPEYWLDGRKLSGGEKRWFDLLSKFDFFDEDKWDMLVRAGVESEDPKSRSCVNCGKDCNRDNCRIFVAHGNSWFSPRCKECERMEKASADPAQRSVNCFEAWWRSRSLTFKSRVQAEGFVLTVFLHSVCVGAPQFSGREVAHLRLQANGPTSIDWYDHEPLAAGDRDPMRQYTTDRTTSCNDNKILPYSHRRQCTVAASAWKNA
ncbi:hypothetical protein BGZ95_003045, partial [Linnemannia exigua]